MSVRLGIVGCGSVFWTPYMSLIERLRGQGRVDVVALYDADPEKRRAAAERLDLSPDLPSDEAVCTHPDVDAVLVLTSMPEHGRLARAALEAGKHVLVEKPVATTLEEAAEVLEVGRARARPPPLRAAHPALPHLSRDARPRRRGVGRRAAHRPRPLRLGGPGLEPLVLRAGRRRALRPRRLQRHEPVRLLRARAAGDGDDGRRDPRARDRRRADPGAGGGQCARADRLRRRALRGRHHRLHDAAVPLAVHRALRHPRRAADARRRLGAGGLRAVAQRPLGLGGAPGDRPGVAVDGRAAPPRRVHRDRARRRSRGPSTPTTRSRSCSRRRPRGRTAARARSRSDFPAPDLARLGAVGGGGSERVHDPRSAL